MWGNSPCANEVQEIHLQIGLSPHMTGVKPKNPTSTKLAYQLDLTNNWGHFQSWFSKMKIRKQVYWTVLRFGITKPAKSRMNSIVKLPAVIEATIVWKNDARKRKMDIAAKWTAKRIKKWRKNLKTKLLNSHVKKWFWKPNDHEFEKQRSRFF